MNKLTKEQMATWDRLNYVPPSPTDLNKIDLDLNSLYPAMRKALDNIVLTFNQTKEVDSGMLKTVKVFKNR